jgi:hypothetical protein
MSSRLDPSWTVLASPSTTAVDRCVDVFAHPDGTFGFEEFRRDPEDMGAWTPVAYFSDREYATRKDQREGLRRRVLSPLLGSSVGNPRWARGDLNPHVLADTGT